ncbi:tetratricopeptide repeat protein [Rhizobium sp. TRM95796]|uniref:tetratricopeptide repeat protein n=1 Tax=Rhizobium sp. TRM95796 TaxID=2979862 RepID=UPI0021E82BBD|nr:tetratricopeptide repeat protein [Rhizobium sp. TRM95796]MCV3767461.1 sel1 repeat family protein [Rhizobium sp. TRM95796]
MTAKRSIWAGLLGLAALLAALHGAQAASTDVMQRMLGGGDESRAIKRDRLAPTGNAEALPALNSPQKSDIAPSGGLSLLARMGASLPDLPPEKPFQGKVDDAYGAYQRGYYLEAMDLALPRAQKGESAAQTLVAELLNNGLGVRRNPKDAVFWYEQAARAGDANAQFKYALMLMDGGLVARDKKKADDMMWQAARGGNPQAQFNVAQILVAAKPGPDGLTEALPWYEKAAAKGVPDAEYAVAQIYANLPVDAEKKAAARGWLLKAAKSGFDTALFDLAVWNINGVAGPRDYETGFQWMKRAANRGHVLAQNKLAHLYVYAIGTRPDPVEAAKWYVLSRRAGFADLDLEDFFLGIEDEQQKEAIHRANQFRAR